MGQEFLIDTNVVIDFLGGNLPEKAFYFMDTINPKISVITRIELLGWYQAPASELQKIDGIVKETHIFTLDERIILKTIELRQNYRLKTPDAIIAATAMAENLTLLSRNTSDFNNITGLALLNPWELHKTIPA